MVVIDPDLAFMERALFLAERGRGRTTPNPIVGAVLVSGGGVVVGQGAHLVAGGPHAEIVAIEAAGERARGATLYCTLEPCAHRGRTGPCVERIVEAGIRRVVVAIGDPNPRVAGRGLDYLRAHGIAVTEDVARGAAARQHAAFFTWITRARPHVTLKAAVSVDGFVGRRDARVHLTSDAADRYFHRQRAEIDAIAVGSTTVLCDDPLLTARGAFRYRPLTRVIFDWRARIPPTARVFSTLAEGPVIIVTLAPTLTTSNPDRIWELRGIGVIALERRRLDLALERLATQGIVSLLVEGGPELHEALAQAGLADRVQLVRTAQPLRDGVPLAPSLLPYLSSPPARRLGEDLLIECDVHRTD